MDELETGRDGIVIFDVCGWFDSVEGFPKVEKYGVLEGEGGRVY